MVILLALLLALLLGVPPATVVQLALVGLAAALILCLFLVRDDRGAP
jgi:hypothetical protein